MPRATRRISRTSRVSAARHDIATTPSAAASRTPIALANEAPRRIHHHDAGGQPAHDGNGGEPLDERTRAGDLPGELVEHLRDGAGAEPQAQHSHRRGRYEAAEPSHSHRTDH